MPAPTGQEVYDQIKNEMDWCVGRDPQDVLRRLRILLEAIAAALLE